MGVKLVREACGVRTESSKGGVDYGMKARRRAHTYMRRSTKKLNDERWAGTLSERHTVVIHSQCRSGGGMRPRKREELS